MEMIRSRNAQSAMPALLSTLFEAEQKDGDQVVDHPVVFTFEKPRERMIYWPGIRRNPAGEMAQALQSLSQTEDALESAAEAVKSGANHFLFSTPQLMVQGRLGTKGELNLYAVIADENPFTGAFGQIGLQLSLLGEAIAKAGKMKLGELTVQHQRLRLPSNVVAQLMQGTLQGIPEDPYDNGMKPRTLELPLDLKMLIEEGEQASGYKSKWIRHVALPLLAAGRAKTPAEGKELAKKIKADDWRRSMIEWCEAAQLAEEARQESETSEE